MSGDQRGRSPWSTPPSVQYSISSVAFSSGQLLQLLRHNLVFRKVKNVFYWGKHKYYLLRRFGFLSTHANSFPCFPPGLFCFQPPRLQISMWRSHLESRHRYHHLPILVGCKPTYLLRMKVFQ